MNVRSSSVRGVLLAPVFLYVAITGWLRFTGWTVEVALVVALLALPLLELVVPRAAGRLFVPAWALAMITGVGLANSNGAPTGLWATVGAGTLLGAPLALLAGLLVWRESRIVTIVGTEAGLGALLALFSASGQAVASGTTGASGWLLAFSNVNTNQITSLEQWVTGGGAPALPILGAVADPLFIGLGLLAAIGVVLVLMERPERAGAGPDPWDPHFAVSSGVLPLVAAALAGFGAEWVSGADPSHALLVIVAGVLVGLGLVVGLAYLPASKDRRGAARSAPATR